MQRHLIDKARGGAGTARLMHYLRFERAQSPARATVMLQRRLRKGAETTRVKEFLRIERRIEA